MKLVLNTLLVLLAMAWTSTSSHAVTGFTELGIGSEAPHFELPGIDGKTHTLKDYQSSKILMIAFISNHCPSSQGAEKRILKLIEDYQDKGLTVVAINPNNPDGLRPDELGYSKYNDGFEDMQKHAKEQGFTFPYLYDGETQETAKAYGCLATPHVFIFDAERKLRYKGRFDDSPYAREDTVKSPDARNAVAALLEGKAVPVEVTRPHGCSTKWLEKKAEVAKDQEHFENEPVVLEPIDAAGIEALVKNGSGKYRLINLWATWCGPCVKEFPILVNTGRKFSMRNFEFISISLDDPADSKPVLAFLQKQHAGTPSAAKKRLSDEGRKTNNYHYSSTDQDALAKVFDPEWPGPIPHTILVSPEGKIVYRHNGEVKEDVLHEEVLKVLGRFYVP